MQPGNQGQEHEQANRSLGALIFKGEVPDDPSSHPFFLEARCRIGRRV